jgi:hypothetical protein
MRHASALRKDIGKDADIRQNNKKDHPNYLKKSRYIGSAKQVTRDRDEQPEPQDEHEYRKGIDNKVRKRKAICEDHGCSPSVA